MFVQNSRGRGIQLGEEINKGGEARILKVKGKPNLVAKIYYADKVRAEQEAKLKAMLARRPVQPATHTALAWPIELLYQQGQLVGFLMPKISGYEPIVKVYNPARRKRQYPSFNWRYLHRTALNLAVAVETVHRAGHLIGDLNESNILVNNQALVTLVDTDSFQIRDKQGQIYRCSVGKPEYTPPELQGVSFQKVNRAPEHDHFALAILIFQLLMQGYHPFSGLLPAGLSVKRVDLYGIKEGLFPYYYQNDEQFSVRKPPNAPSLTLLPPNLQALFIRSFVNGHHHPTQRPKPARWQVQLQKAERSLQTCQHNPTHFYSNHLSTCPWCARQRKRKPLAPPIQKLPPLSRQRSAQPQSSPPRKQRSLGKFSKIVIIYTCWFALCVGCTMLERLNTTQPSDSSQPPASQTIAAPSPTETAYPSPTTAYPSPTTAYPSPTTAYPSPTTAYPSPTYQPYPDP